MNSNDYTAYIIANADDDELTAVDVRTLDADDRAALRADATANGDADLVATIDRVAAWYAGA